MTPYPKLPPGNPKYSASLLFPDQRMRVGRPGVGKSLHRRERIHWGQAREKVVVALAWANSFVYMRTMQLVFVSQLLRLVRRLIEPKPTGKVVLNTIASPAMDGIRSCHWTLALFWVISVSACKFTHTETNNAPPPPSVTVSSGEQSQVIDWETATARICLT